ncbi:MAG: hypothetical protein ABI175_00360 [Polyangiales bacterium]
MINGPNIRLVAAAANSVKPIVVSCIQCGMLPRREIAEHQICGLEVAMDHAARVRVVDGQADRRKRGE